MTKHPPLVLIIEDLAGIRLDRWLRNRYPALRQGMIEKLLRQGKIRLNNEKVEAGTRVEVGQVITAPQEIADLSIETAPQPFIKPYTLTAEDRTLLKSSILWEDEDILVLNKPHNLAVQGGNKISRSLDAILQNYGQEQSIRYRLVHRLDRYTSGVFIVAKNQATAAHLTKGFREGDIAKTYWAIVLRQPDPDHGTIRNKLAKGGIGDREKVYVDDKNGKLAITKFRTIKKLSRKKAADLSWLELYPETGRTHQVRVHCQYLGVPIIGDGKYGGKEAICVSSHLHLHARSIMIRDKDGNKLEFVAEPPPHFINTLMMYDVEWSRYAR
jgi:23S rRNA pseudouridine955/2504/2580 synthase